MQPLEALSSVERKERDTTSAPSASRWLQNPDAQTKHKSKLELLLDEWENSGTMHKPATERMWWEK